VARTKLNAKDLLVLEVADSYVGKLSITHKDGLAYDAKVWRTLWETYSTTVYDYLAAYKPKKKPKKGTGK